MVSGNIKYQERFSVWRCVSCTVPKVVRSSYETSAHIWISLGLLPLLLPVDSLIHSLHFLASYHGVLEIVHQSHRNKARLNALHTWQAVSVLGQTHCITPSKGSATPVAVLNNRCPDQLGNPQRIWKETWRDQAVAVRLGCCLVTLIHKYVNVVSNPITALDVLLVSTVNM